MLSKQAKKLLNCYTKSVLKKWKTACEKLRKRYEAEINYSACPLCDLAFELEYEENLLCDKCLWNTFFGKSCEIYADRWVAKRDIMTIFPIETAKKYPEWRKLRIKQLTEWLKYINEALKG